MCTFVADRGGSVVAIGPPHRRDEMLLTEDEAIRKWCPRAHDGSEQKCIASRCMAWRWQPLMADQLFMDAVKRRMDDSKDKHPAAVKYVRANLAEFDLPDKPFRGFCGLAGKP